MLGKSSACANSAYKAFPLVEGLGTGLHHHHLLFKPTISLSEQASALIFSPNLSTVDGGVHGQKAIVFLSPLIPTVDRGALHGQTLNDARGPPLTEISYTLPEISREI